MEDAIYLSSLCKKVYVFVRNSSLKAQVVLQNTLFDSNKKNNNIEILYNTQVKKLLGENKLEEIEIELAVKGMLPKSNMGREMLKRLKVY